MIAYRNNQLIKFQLSGISCCWLPAGSNNPLNISCSESAVDCLQNQLINWGSAAWNQLLITCRINHSNLGSAVWNELFCLLDQSINQVRISSLESVWLPAGSINQLSEISCFALYINQSIKIKYAFGLDFVLLFYSSPSCILYIPAPSLL